ncbi:MAG: type II toxin-antitoxin system VapC family toxin [Candidatus Methylomirabilales bacterium]
MICLDASLVLKLVLPEPDRPHVRELWDQWVDQRETICAPWLFPFEVHSVLRQKVARGVLGPGEDRAAWAVVHGLGIQIQHEEGLWDLAWVLAQKYQRPTTYDVVYLALAEILDCDFWTADRRLLAALGGREPRVRSVSTTE